MKWRNNPGAPPFHIAVYDLNDEGIFIPVRLVDRLEEYSDGRTGIVLRNPHRKIDNERVIYTRETASSLERRINHELKTIKQ